MGLQVSPGPESLSPPNAPGAYHQPFCERFSERPDIQSTARNQVVQDGLSDLTIPYGPVCNKEPYYLGSILGQLRIVRDRLSILGPLILETLILGPK